jgi:SAM-dependent methyltransferase
MFTLDQVVQWGRSFAEYCRMFALTDTDRARRILGVGDGPASFNAEATRRGWHVVSCDPLYQFGADAIRQRIADTYVQILEQTRLNQHEFVWHSIGSVDELGRRRMEAMQEFLSDYPDGLLKGRYVTAELPTLPFRDREFDLAVSSHLLFLYSSQLGEAFHHASLLELCRVAREVRVFPLVALGSTPSPFVESTSTRLREAGHDVCVDQVPYEFQRGGNQMMRVITGVVRS